MNDTEPERVRAAAMDLVEALGAYQRELGALGQGLPGVGPLRQALLDALAEARLCISDRDAVARHVGRTTH